MTLFFTGCDKIPGGVVDFQSVDYKVTNLSAPTSEIYTKSDSSVVTSVHITNTASLSAVWCQVSSVDRTISVIDKVNMYDDGNTSGDGDVARNDGTYTGKFFMSRTNPNGKYQIEYFAEDNVNRAPDNVTKIGAATFSYDNGQNNLPPVISNLVLPAAVNRGDSFVFSVQATDPNGAADISQVYFRLYRPDGTLVDPGNSYGYFLMVDDGDPNLGDQVAGDGIYSFKNSFSSTTQTGSWKFVFQAKDRSGLLSNVITQTITVN